MKNVYYRRGSIVFVKINRKNEPPTEIKIDVADLPKVRSYRSWHMIGGRSGIEYVRGRDNTSSNWVLLHRVINETPEGMKCTFLNGDTFDCRKDNLKSVDDPRRHAARRRSPDYYIRRNRGPNAGYSVKLWLNGKTKYLGTFPTIEDARKARDAALKKAGKE
jgi:hypothetical protein